MNENRKKFPWYNEGGDQIEYQNKDIAAVAEWIDPFLTILRDYEDNSIVGAVLCEVKHWIDGEKVELTAEQKIEMHKKLEAIFGKMEPDKFDLIELAYDAFNKLRGEGKCWCGVSMGHPLMKSHGEGCELAQKFVREVREEGMV